ncbi:uncharacterized protein MYCFIDRAFT_89416 [Pseudocercospora fijiensis CIRAD86]|uniref:Uncharacterized protein n=1 Tax=Pseudocercospora fijiensis (strain CIRAD86) TaxID=383855 RepID=N1Q731_PSEFD|nr:uncharacterized protein MYCFIDRAFT_89416 [Pseudocercospora fijiensis CIRAD86]EME87321.1 hypothetical protein MYCFIDRAFT_89416 [Pseudocercospora fijiensis CIRAD86]
MGCTKIGHQHEWPTSGKLVIERCEDRCNFCTGEDKQKKWKFAWFLRRHVRSVHIKNGPYSNLTVSDAWDEDESGGKGRSRKGAKGKRRVKKEEDDDSDTSDGLPYQKPLPGLDTTHLMTMNDFIQDPTFGQGVLLGNEIIEREQLPANIQSDDIDAVIDRLGRNAARTYHQAVHGTEELRPEDIPVESIEQDDQIGANTDNLEAAAWQFNVAYNPSPSAEPAHADAFPNAYEGNDILEQTAGDFENIMQGDYLPMPTMPTDLDESLQVNAPEIEQEDANYLPSDSSFFEDEWFGYEAAASFDPFFFSDSPSPPSSVFDELPLSLTYTTTPPSPTQASVDALGAFTAVHEEVRIKGGVGKDDMTTAFEMFQSAIGESPDDIDLAFEQHDSTTGLWQSNPVILD